MTRDECVSALRGFIARADRGELEQAQAAILAFAFEQPDEGARAQAVAQLQRDLAGSLGGLSEPMQQAYHSVVDAMIDRTREAVRDPGAPPA